MKCKNCGNEINADCDYCPKCGKQLNGEEKHINKHNSIGSLIGAAMLAMALCGGGYYYFISNNATTTVSAKVKTKEEMAKKAFTEGLEKVKQNDLDSAKLSFTKAIEIYPEYHEAYYELAVVEMKKENWQAADVDFSKVIELKPRYKDTYYQRGLASLYQKKIDSAIKDFSNMIDIDSKHDNAYCYRGYCYLLNLKFDSAISDLSNAIGINNKNYTAEKLLGDCYFYKKDFPQAKEYYQKSINNKPDFEASIHNLKVTERAIVAAKGDLKILSVMSHEELKVIVNLMGKKLSARLPKAEDFNSNYPKYYKEIAEEFKLFGGNTLGNIFRRGRGVPYKEILTDVCSEKDVEIKKDLGIIEIEQLLLEKVEKDALERMTPEERAKYQDTINIKDGAIMAYNAKGLVLAAAVPMNYVFYAKAVYLCNALSYKILGHILPYAINIGALKLAPAVVGCLNPVFAIASFAALSFDFAKPAYSIVNPITIYIAAKRQEFMNAQLL